MIFLKWYDCFLRLRWKMTWYNMNYHISGLHLFWDTLYSVSIFQTFISVSQSNVNFILVLLCPHLNKNGNSTTGIHFKRIYFTLLFSTTYLSVSVFPYLSIYPSIYLNLFICIYFILFISPPSLSSPVGLGFRIYELHLCRGVGPPLQRVSWHDTKQNDGEVPIMLELWRMRSTT